MWIRTYHVLRDVITRVMRICEKFQLTRWIHMTLCSESLSVLRLSWCHWRHDGSEMEEEIVAVCRHPETYDTSSYLYRDRTKKEIALLQLNHSKICPDYSQRVTWNCHSPETDGQANIRWLFLKANKHKWSSGQTCTSNAKWKFASHLVWTQHKWTLCLTKLWTLKEDTSAETGKEGKLQEPDQSTTPDWNTGSWVKVLIFF